MQAKSASEITCAVLDRRQLCKPSDVTLATATYIDSLSEDNTTFSNYNFFSYIAVIYLNVCGMLLTIQRTNV